MNELNSIVAHLSWPLYCISKVSIQSFTRISMFLFFWRNKLTRAWELEVSELMDAIPCDHDTPGIALRWLGGLSKEILKTCYRNHSFTKLLFFIPPYVNYVLIIYLCVSPFLYLVIYLYKRISLYSNLYEREKERVKELRLFLF